MKPYQINEDGSLEVEEYEHLGRWRDVSLTTLNTHTKKRLQRNEKGFMYNNDLRVIYVSTSTNTDEEGYRKMYLITGAVTGILRIIAGFVGSENITTRFHNDGSGWKCLESMVVPRFNNFS